MSAMRRHSPWWRRAAGAVLVYFGMGSVLYSSTLPLPRWQIELPLLGVVAWPGVILGLALVGIGLGTAQGRRWARAPAALAGVAYLAMDLAVVLESGWLWGVAAAALPALIVIATVLRWSPRAVDRSRRDPDPR